MVELGERREARRERVGEAREMQLLFENFFAGALKGRGALLNGRVKPAQLVEETERGVN